MGKGGKLGGHYKIVILGLFTKQTSTNTEDRESSSYYVCTS